MENANYSLIDSSISGVSIDNSPNGTELEYDGDLESDVKSTSISTESELSTTIESDTSNQLYSDIGNYSQITDTLNEIVKQNYDRQIAEYRYNNHWEYIESKRRDNDNAYNSITNNKQPSTINVDNSKPLKDINAIKAAVRRIDILNKVKKNSIVHKWPKKTILVASDSMFCQLDEQRLCKNNFTVKVRSFKGSTVEDMYSYLYPLLRKEPDHLILHVGTNDCVNHSANIVLDDIRELKQHIEDTVPGIKVILSIPVERFDGNLEACKRVRSVIGNLMSSNLSCLDNTNIERKHIGSKGLHLNNYGTGILVISCPFAVAPISIKAHSTLRQKHLLHVGVR